MKRSSIWNVGIHTGSNDFCCKKYKESDLATRPKAIGPVLEGGVGWSGVGCTLAYGMFIGINSH